MIYETLTTYSYIHIVVNDINFLRRKVLVAITSYKLEKNFTLLVVYMSLAMYVAKHCSW